MQRRASANEKNILRKAPAKKEGRVAGAVKHTMRKLHGAKI